MTLETWLAFSVTAAALAIVPGPTVTVIIANSLRFGPRAGLLNVAGTQAGVAIWLAIAALGLGTAIEVMGVYFDILRYAGAAYLVWLGVKLLRSKGDLAGAVERARPKGSFFLQGFIVIMSNPKMLVLFGALIPPFIQPDGDYTRQLLSLGLTFAAIVLVGDTAYALAAGSAGRFLSRSRVRAIEIISGLCLTAGGVWLALKSR
ncbi:MAG: LysE family translocator [Rhizobiales bacterium]|nr:LysE family translocator [Hyphomicrobiales bacterium]MBI3672485.1 LysE family translocator [Hyphomicrobiales bacterium]